jgi:PKD repeat protein
MLKRVLYIFIFALFSNLLSAQCPQIYDYLGNLVSKPYFINCTGSPNYNVNFASNTSWGAYSINWGDGTTNDIGTNYVANSIINHTYNSATPDTFEIKLIIPSLSCTLTGIAVMEKPVNASIQIPIGGVTTACAPKALLFTNSSTDVSETTQFTWNFGDGSPVQTFNYTNSGQTISHTYNKNTVNCQTMVTLTAKNYCTSVPTIANFNPIQIYDVDDAAITPSAYVKCWPDNSFIFNNTTNRNCVPQGNTFQRQEKWNFGNYWGLGHDSIINWRPWPPTASITIAYPSIGSYTVQLQDSNLCGIDVQQITVTIVNPPTAGLIGPTSPRCQSSAVSFTNTSSPGYTYRWNFGDGGGFTSRPYGTQSYTYNNAGIYTVSLVALINGGGAACSDTEKVVISILPKPTANFSVSPNKGCNSISGVSYADLSLNAIDWNWNFGNGNIFNGQIPPSQNYTTTGVFITTLTVTAANTCVNTFTVPINVYPKPKALFSLSSACVGAITSFSNNSIGFAGEPILSQSWNFGDGIGTATILNPTYSYSAQNTYSVQLIVNTANCKDTLVQNILINTKPTANFSVVPSSGCPTLSVSFTNSSSNANSYTWDFGNGNSSTITNPSEVFTNTLSTNRIYTISLTALTGVGCSDTKTTSVTVFSKPLANLSVNAPAGCSPVAATFSNSSVGALNYLWSFGDGNTSNSSAGILSHTFTNNTLLIQTYTTQLISISANGCRDSVNVYVTAYPKPIFNFTMVPNSGCTPLTINFPSVPGVVSYQWNFGDGSPVSNSTNPTHTFTNSTTTTKNYTVQLVASNAFSCIDTTYGSPTVFPKPQANFTSTFLQGCSPLAVTFTNTSTGSSSYLWRFGDNQSSLTTNTNHTFINSSNTVNQTYSCTLIATSINNCTDSITKPITAFYKPEARFILDTPICASSIISFTNNSLGNTGNSWNFGDGSALSTNVNPNHTYTNNTISNTNYTIQLVVSSPSSCLDTAYGYTTIFAKPIADFIITPTVGCSPLNVTTTNTSNFAHTYVWKFGDGNIDNNINSSNNYINTSNTSSRTYSCILIANNNNGCKDSISKQLLVFHNPNANFSVDTPSCSPKLLSFVNTSIGANTYNWDFGTSISTNTNATHQFINTTTTNITNTVQLVATSLDLCRDTIIVPIIIHPKPEFLITALPDSGCTPLAVSFPLINDVTSYQWNFGDGNGATNGNPTNIFHNTSPNTKTYTVQLIASNAYGCGDTSFKIIKVFPKPVALFQANPNTVYIPNNPVNCINQSAGATNYYWDFGDNSNSSETNPSHLYESVGEYQIYLIAINLNGCRDTFNLPSKINAVLESKIEIPNAFTPNPNGSNGGIFNDNDLNNDVFHPIIKGIDKYELNIFSRWGELLFVSKDINIGWDGYYKGVLCTQDVYVWKIIATTIDGKKINETGDVLLLK